MKVQCRTRELLDAVTLVSGVIPSNATRPILLDFLLKTENGGLVIQGTDLDVGLSVRLDDVIAEKEGSVVVPAGRFHSILREAHDEEITLEAIADGQVQITFGNAQFKVPTESPSEFPVLDFKSPATRFTTDCKRLLESLRRVAIAAARDATRFQMHAVLLDCRPDAIRLVSTDGKRMAVDEQKVVSHGDGTSGNSQYIVPLKGVDLLVKILATEEAETVDLHLDQHEISYFSDRVSLSCRLVEGKYPPYERAIPERGAYVIDLNTEKLQTVLRQAALMTTKETNSVHFSFQADRLVLSTHASSVGESRIEMEVKKVEGPEEEFSITFNPYYLLDLIKVIDTPVLRGHFKDSKTAGLFFIDGEQDAYRYIVMPLVTTA